MSTTTTTTQREFIRVQITNSPVLNSIVMSCGKLSFTHLNTKGTTSAHTRKALCSVLFTMTLLSFVLQPSLGILQVTSGLGNLLPCNTYRRRLLKRRFTRVAGRSATPQGDFLVAPSAGRANFFSRASPKRLAGFFSMEILFRKIDFSVMCSAEGSCLERMAGG